MQCRPLSDACQANREHLRLVGGGLVRYERVRSAGAAVAYPLHGPECVLEHDQLGGFGFRDGEFRGKAGKAEGVREVLVDRLRYALGERCLVLNGGLSRRDLSRVNRPETPPDVLHVEQASQTTSCAAAYAFALGRLRKPI